MSTFFKATTPIMLLANLLAAAVLGSAGHACAQESLWIEAEHLDGVRGHCWPMGRPEMKKTSGHWGLSGPGWAAEWNMGGESGFLSIATAADDDRAVATKTRAPSSGVIFSAWTICVTSERIRGPIVKVR